MRYQNISDTISYVESRRQELMNLMLSSKTEGSSVKYISNLVADILGNINKCLDYCAKDLYEKYISENSKNKKVYFPLYIAQLQNSKNEINKLKRHEEIYNHLVIIIENVEKDTLIENTIIPYSTIKTLRDIVNSDKHDKLIEIDQMGREEVIGVNQNIKIIVPKIQVGINNEKIEVLPGQDKQLFLVKSYRLLINDADVADFLLNAQMGTKRIIDDIYEKFLETTNP